ncbi:hypothetical protein NKJ70_05915 [Mesorhizobium sp. M0092]|uniref:hypothetical protein n=1 Tax=Mesorhizobium sp. M0092 TaxID=2956876 RepID=UPI00333C73B4
MHIVQRFIDYGKLNREEVMRILGILSAALIGTAAVFGSVIGETAEIRDVDQVHAGGTALLHDWRKGDKECSKNHVVMADETKVAQSRQPNCCGQCTTGGANGCLIANQGDNGYSCQPC